MSRRHVTRGTWPESQGQSYVLNIPGLLRVWRPGSHHPSQRNQPTRFPYDRRGSALRNGERYLPDDSHGHQVIGPDYRGTVPYSYQPNSALDSPSPFDSWERLRDSLQLDRQEQAPQGPSHGFHDLEPLYEVREPAWAKGEPEEHHPGISSRYADRESRCECRRSHRASDYEDDHRDDQHPQRPRFASPAPGHSEHLQSHTPTSSSQFDRGVRPVRRTSGERYRGDKFIREVPPFTPDPPFYSSSRHSDARPFYSRTCGHVGRDRCYVREEVFDDGFSDGDGYYQ